MQLKATFDNANGRLWAGQFTATSLHLFDEDGALVVPTQAIVNGQRGTYVYVVDQADTARQRGVVVERQESGLAIIASGIHEGDRVVTDGQSRLTPDAPVRIRGANDLGGGGNGAGAVRRGGRRGGAPVEAEEAAGAAERKWRRRRRGQRLEDSYEPDEPVRSTAGHDDADHDRHPRVRDRLVPEVAGERPAHGRLPVDQRRREPAGCEPGNDGGDRGHSAREGVLGHRRDRRDHVQQRPRPHQRQLQFALDRSVEAAAQDVNAAIGKTLPFLPSTILPPNYHKQNPSAAPI